MENARTPSQISPQDERVLAAIAHAGIILPMWGMIAPVLIWITQREKSNFVAFHALQAAIYQFVLIAAWFASGACYMASIFLILAGTFTVSGPNNSVSGALFVLPFIMVIAIAFLSLAAVVLGVVAAVLTYQGKDFRYPLVARWADRYQQNNPAR
jgi:uncharacterized Tic20 family protein